MQMNLRTDYALRMLMALAAKEEVVSIDWLAEHYDISRNHLAKVAQDLAAAGFIETQRGRGGGVRLARAPSDICIGHVVRSLENTTGFVACMGGRETCVVERVCGLKPALAGALEAFLAHLDQFSLAQITGAKPRFLKELIPEDS